MQIISNPIPALNVPESPKFLRLVVVVARNTMVTSNFGPEVEVKIRLFHACAMKNVQHSPYLWQNWRNFYVLKEIWARNTMVTSDFRPEVEIWPFRARVMHPTIIIGTVRSLWTCYGADTTFHRTYFWL